jgi:hypothetical protein
MLEMHRNRCTFAQATQTVDFIANSRADATSSRNSTRHNR